MRVMRKFLAAMLTAALLCTAVFASSGFDAGLTIDRATAGQISVTVKSSSVLEERRPTLTIPCDYTYAEVTCPDGTKVYCTGTGAEVSFTVFAGGTYLVKSIAELPPEDEGDTTPDVVTPVAPGTTVSPGVSNEDGSTTVTKVDRLTGATTTTTTTTTGVTGTTVTDKSGAVTEISASIPAKAAEDAAESDASVTLPVEVPVVTSTDEAVAVEISVPASVGSVTVEIPTEELSAGLVAVIVGEDGEEKIVKTSVVTENGVSLTVEGNTVVKIIDNSSDFVDISDSDWYEEAADFVSSRELFGGVSTTAAVFDGDGAMTRGMLAVVLHRLEDEPVLAADGTLGGDFADIADGLWYSEAVSWAAQEGIVTGYGDTFGPMDNITREQLAVMLWRYAGCPESDHELSHCPDADQISDYARQAMAWANEVGIIGGTGGNILAPKSSATRAQVAQMLKNYLENV